jgi:hypothetical protein
LAPVRRNGGVFIAYLTLACWSWTGGFVLGSLSRAMSAVNTLLLCLILFFGQVIGAPDYFAFFRDRAFGDLHLPDANAAVFEVGFYRVVLPVIVQIVLVAIPALWGFRVAMGMGKLRRLVRTGLWAAAIATLAVVLMPEIGFWLFLATGIFHTNIWAGIMSAVKYLQPLEFWPVVFLIAHAIRQRALRRAKA